MNFTENIENCENMKNPWLLEKELCTARIGANDETSGDQETRTRRPGRAGREEYEK